MFSGVLASSPGTRLTEKKEERAAASVRPLPAISYGTASHLGAAAGFALNQLALTAAGEIIPEGRTSARTANKPEVPVSLD